MSPGTAPPGLMMAGQKGDETMSDTEKTVGEQLKESLYKLDSPELKDKALTYIEGMAAAADCLRRKKEED